MPWSTSVSSAPMAHGSLAAMIACEKPLAPTSADAQAMIDAVEAAGVVARVGFTFRRAPGIAAVRQQLKSGRLGQPIYLSAQYLTNR
jgi:predicted dehydrogenase